MCSGKDEGGARPGSRERHWHRNSKGGHGRGVQRDGRARGRAGGGGGQGAGQGGQGRGEGGRAAKGVPARADRTAHDAAGIAAGVHERVACTNGLRASRAGSLPGCGTWQLYQGADQEAATSSATRRSICASERHATLSAGRRPYRRPRRRKAARGREGAGGARAAGGMDGAQSNASVGARTW